MKATKPGRLLASSAFLIWSLFGVSSAMAQNSVKASWNAFAIVSGQLQSDGTVFACDNPEARVKGNDCWLPGWVASNVGRPRRMDVAELLQQKLKGTLPQGKTARLVGVGPSWSEANRSVVLDKDRFVVFYNVE